MILKIVMRSKRRRRFRGLEIQRMRRKSMAKVMRAEEVMSSGREKLLISAMIERASIEMATVRPVGTEY